MVVSNSKLSEGPIPQGIPLGGTPLEDAFPKAHPEGIPLGKDSFGESFPEGIPLGRIGIGASPRKKKNTLLFKICSHG